MYPHSFTVFGVDPTFTLGDFDVTITTYRHLLLQSKSSGKSPVMIGPIFVHMRKDFATYHFFASSLISLNPDIASLKAFGTDGEAALENALSAAFPNALHLRCFLHFRGNVENKLRELGIPSVVAKEIVCDIMGRASALEYGLVDAKHGEELGVLLKAVKTRWNELEKPYNNLPRFHSWFEKYCGPVIARSMVQEVRQNAGLGCPPEPYYTNEVESKNKLIKEEVQYKKSQLPDFITKMSEMMFQQRREIERAVLNSGEYSVQEQYHHLTVETTKWFQMTVDQRNRKVARFMKAPVATPASISASNSECPLDVITCLPKQQLHGIWSKADSLAEDESAIKSAPGDEAAWMVKSYSGKQPHYVKSGKTSGFICDEHCLSYKSSKICAHSVALAIKQDRVPLFLKWYQRIKQKPNYTTVGESGRPSSCGKKPSKRKGSTKSVSAKVRQVISQAEEEGINWRNHCSEETDSSEFELHDTETYQHTTVPGSSFNFVSNQSVQIGSITSPPPLISASSLPRTPSTPLTPDNSRRPDVECSFWLAFVFGNVSRCNGCKGKIRRGDDKKPLPPPDDLVVGHKEHVVYQNPHSGNFELSREKRNVYYHPWRTCIAPNFRNFDPTLHINTDRVRGQLLPVHKQLLLSEFGLIDL